MAKPRETVIEHIKATCLDRRLSTAESLDALENLQDFIAGWIDALKGDLRDEKNRTMSQGAPTAERSGD